MKLFNWFRQRTTDPVVVSPPTPTRFNGWKPMTLDQWRDSPNHIRYARSLLADPMFMDLIAVLHNTMPVSNLSDLDATGAAVQLGRVRGYQEALVVLDSLARWPEQQPSQIEADYGVDQEEKT